MDIGPTKKWTPVGRPHNDYLTKEKPAFQQVKQGEGVQVLNVIDVFNVGI